MYKYRLLHDIFEDKKTRLYTIDGYRILPAIMYLSLFYTRILSGYLLCANFVFYVNLIVFKCHNVTHV